MSRPAPGPVEPPTGLPALSAAELRHALLRDLTDTAEVLVQHRARAEATEPAVRALVHHLDADPSPSRYGPLAGVPVAVKDNIAIEATPLTCASRARLAETPSTQDAELVRRIRAAGATVVAKTNLDEFAMGASTETSCFGPTHNPHALDRTPGGSSGGSAATVAAHQVPLAVGTDTGGSTREPAAQCGLVGVKPTLGSVPTDGVVPFAPSLDQPGPLARTVGDAALLHDVLADAGGEIVRAAEEAGREVDLTGTRVGVVAELSGQRNADGVRARFDAAVDLLDRLGAYVVEISCPTVEEGLETYFAISSLECLPTLADPLATGLLGAEATRRHEIGLGLTAEPGALEAAHARALAMKDELAGGFDEVDLLVSPTMPTTAARLGGYLDDPLAVPRTDCWTVVANLTGVPAISLPGGPSPIDGLPVGVQLMAPHGADAALYRAGAALERAGLTEHLRA